MPRKSFWIAASLGALSSLAGCGPMQYIYTPATTTLTSSRACEGPQRRVPVPARLAARGHSPRHVRGREGLGRRGERGPAPHGHP